MASNDCFPKQSYFFKLFEHLSDAVSLATAPTNVSKLHIVHSLQQFEVVKNKPSRQIYFFKVYFDIVGVPRVQFFQLEDITTRFCF